MLLNTTSTNEVLTIVILCVCIFAVGALIIAAFIIRFKKMVKEGKKEIETTVDPNVREEFLSAYGGKENIIEVVKDMTRIKIKVNDIEKVNTEKLKELGAVNVYILENEVRSSFADRVDYVYNILK